MLIKTGGWFKRSSSKPVSLFDHAGTETAFLTFRPYIFFD